MLTFAYPEVFSPRSLAPRGSFTVIHDGPLDWPGLVIGPSLAGDLPRGAEFLASARGKIVPLCEDAVFAAALADPSWREPAIACTHRRRQAQCLDDLAPRWWSPHAYPLVAPPWWFKAPASDMSRGVGQVDCVESLERVATSCRRGAADNLRCLRQLVPELDDGIVQEHLPGPQYEITGVVADGERELWFEPLRQTWNGMFIERYSPAPGWHEEMAELGSEVVRRLGLSWCFVCIEARRTAEGWKVIEAHCRPGDDPESKGYPAAEHLRRGIEALCFWEAEDEAREKTSAEGLTSPRSAAMPR